MHYLYSLLVSLLNSMSHLSFGIILIITLTLIIHALGKLSVLVVPVFSLPSLNLPFSLRLPVFSSNNNNDCDNNNKIKCGTVGVGYVHRRPSNTMSVLACPG